MCAHLVCTLVLIASLNNSEMQTDGRTSHMCPCISRQPHCHVCRRTCITASDNSAPFDLQNNTSTSFALSLSLSRIATNDVSVCWVRSSRTCGEATCILAPTTSSFHMTCHSQPLPPDPRTCALERRTAQGLISKVKQRMPKVSSLAVSSGHQLPFCCSQIHTLTPLHVHCT